MTDPELTRTVEGMRQRWWPASGVGVQAGEHGKEITMAGPSEPCGCSFSTLPGKELVCAERGGHRGPHQADGVTWTQLFPDNPLADIEGNPLPDEDEQAPLSDFAPPPDLDQAIHAATEALAEAPLDWVHPDTSGFCGKVHREGYDLRRPARIAVEAAWPRSALAELAVLRYSNAQLRDLTREQDQALQATRDRLATLQAFEQAVREAAKCNYDSYGMTQIDKAIAVLDVAAAQENPDPQERP